MMTSGNPSSALWRRLGGIAVAALVLPFLLGDQGCYTVETRIGDPEHAWADPRISGIWITGDRSDAVLAPYAGALWIFDPFDAKTWLVTAAYFKDLRAVDADAAEGGSTSISSKASTGDQSSTGQMVDVPRIVTTLTEERAKPDSLFIYKAWTVTLGGRRFLVLEPRCGLTRKQSLAPEGWYVFAADIKEGRLVLSGLGNDGESLSKAKTRSQAEDIIARHAHDPNFIHPEGVLHPVPKASYDDAFNALRRVLKH